MKRKLAFVCLAAMAAFGCATAELVTPPPLASCDATNDCRLADAGNDALADAPAADTGSDAGAVDAADATTTDASDAGVGDADAAG